MKLSVIVPVYNMEADGKLNRCLDSLLQQEMIADMEIIAVDDKSTDNSLQILRTYESRYPDRIKVIAAEKNGRQGSAKNLGLKAATSEWVGFMDSDDWAHVKMFSSMLQKAEETGADVVGCDYLLTYGGTEGTAVRNNESGQTGELDEEKRRELILKPGSMVVKIYKRSLFSEHAIQFPEKIFYEDNAISELPLLYAKRFERVDEAYYYYYQHAASTVHVVSEERCRDRMKAGEIYKREVTERGFYESYKEAFDYKIYELGYCNTLFSYLQTQKHPKAAFVNELRDYLLRQVPDFDSNPYFNRYMDAEMKKLVRMHADSNLKFYCYYRLLRFYRRLRYGKK